jgi:hypothetical protein
MSPLRQRMTEELRLRARAPVGRRGCGKRPRRTRCATALPRICWRVGWTCA